MSGDGLLNRGEVLDQGSGLCHGNGLAGQGGGEGRGGDGCAEWLYRPVEVRWGRLWVLAVVWVVGTMIGICFLGIGLEVLTGVGVVAGVMMLGMWARRRWRGVRCWGMVLWGVSAVLWAGIKTQYVATDDIAWRMSDEPVLVQVRGVVVTVPVVVEAWGGDRSGLAIFRPGYTWFTLRVKEVGCNGKWRAASGRVVVKVKRGKVEAGVGYGLQMTGWMEGIRGPGNPGEFDWKSWCWRRGIGGRLVLESVLNYEVGAVSEMQVLRGYWDVGRVRLVEAARGALLGGMEGASAEVGALVEALLLGRRSGELEEVSYEFQRAGLTHLLSISGAHLTVLMGLFWLMAGVVIESPGRRGWLVLVVLWGYMWMLPDDVAVWRSGVMATVFCLSQRSGRVVDGMDGLSLAVWVILLQMPEAVGDAGFQLSFGITAALLLGATVLQGRWAPREVLFGESVTGVGWWWRKVAGVLGANVIGFGAALPVVAHHFQMVSVAGLWMSLLVLPVAGLMLGVGFLKMVLGLVWPLAGCLLAWPLEQVTQWVIDLTVWGAGWDGAAVSLGRSPGVIWTVGCLVVLGAWLAGWFVGRGRALCAVVVLLWVGLMIGQHPGAEGWERIGEDGNWKRLCGGEGRGGGEGVEKEAARELVHVYMFSVGNGSCVLMRFSQGVGRSERIWMVDCGSGDYVNVVKAVIGPAMKELGVGRIDVLMLSHSDMDHVSGCVELVKRVAIGQILVSGRWMAEAVAEPESTAGVLLGVFEERKIEVKEVGRGWEAGSEGVGFRILWPSAEEVFMRDNDSSLVLAIEAGGRRLLLNGDIQSEAMGRMLKSGEDLRADVTDLPHHGSVLAVTPKWLAAVGPRLVLQSCNERRLRDARWVPMLRKVGAVRMSTARAGMVEVVIFSDGAIGYRGFVPAEMGR